MRVLVAADRMGALSSAEAGEAIGHGWQQPGVEIAVVPCGDAGAGMIEALGAAWAAPVTLVTSDDGQFAHVVRAGSRAAVALEPVPDPDAFDRDGSSVALGRAVRQLVLDERPDQVVIDLAGISHHDAGAGFLAGLGAHANVSLTAGVAGLTGLAQIDLTAVGDLLAGIDLIGLYPADHDGRGLLGLRGITARLGAEQGLDPAVMLATDAALEQLTDLVDPGAARHHDAGACAGLAWVIRALGGRTLAGIDLLARETHIAQTAQQADVVVTGTTAMDFHHKGGAVVDRAAQWAAAALRPCVVVAGEVMISDRELRLMGIEAAYPVALQDAQQLAADVARVARSWSWQ